MKRLELASWFRRRMVPIVATASLVVATAAPAAFYVQKRRELVRGARSSASRVAAVLRSEIDERPSLWRYDSTKLAARLTAEGLDLAPALVVEDAAGVAVPMRARGEAPRGRWGLHARPLWGRADVSSDGKRLASVWVAADATELLTDTATLAALLGAVLYLLPMRAIRLAERRIRVLVGELGLTLQEEERRRIARDLHDGAGQAITAARLGLVALRRGAGASVEAASAIDGIARHLDEALDEVRHSTAALAPPLVAELGLRGALARHCETFADTTGLTVACDTGEELPRLDAHVETACFRIVQEALTNTARHAGATRAWVRLRATRSALHLEVGDDGAGFPHGVSSTGADAGGRGLEGIRERVRLLDGDVVIGGSAGAGGAGAAVQVTLPIDSRIATS